MNRNSSDTSPHILNTSSNLLGLCFVVLTFIKIQHLENKTFIDELTVIALIFFMISCILSFLSMRGKSKSSERMEKIAEYSFLVGLVAIFSTTLLVAFNLS